MISSKSCFSVLAGREWDVGAGRAKLRCHRTWLQPFPAPVSGCVCSVPLDRWREGLSGCRWLCGCRGSLGCYTTSAIRVLRPRLCMLLLLRSRPSPWVWLRPGSSSGREAIVAWLHGSTGSCSPGTAGLCGAVPELQLGRASTPGLEGQRGAGTVCCAVGVSACPGINRVRNDRSFGSRAGCSMHSQEVTWVC